MGREILESISICNSFLPQLNAFGSYEWNDTVTGMNRPDGTMYGFIAQDLQQVWPEKVKEDNIHS